MAHARSHPFEGKALGSKLCWIERSDCWSAVAEDVSGKGLSSALLASLLQGALMTGADRAAELGWRFQRLNRFLVERTAGEKYAIIFYCLLTADGRLDYVNAAHCPALLIRASGQLIPLEATALPAGLLPEAEFTVATETLTPGDKLIIYTDGLTEAQNAEGEFFGRKRLHELAIACTNESCTIVHDAIRAALAGFIQDTPQADDITIVVLEYQPGSRDSNTEP